MVAKKPSTRTKAAAADPESALPEGGDATAPQAEARIKPPTLKIRELVERVAAATGGKKKGVKEIVDATLAALGGALAKGEDLNLPGLGRTRIARTVEKDGGSMMTLKVRHGAHRKKEANEPLAEEEDDG